MSGVALTIRRSYVRAEEFLAARWPRILIIAAIHIAGLWLIYQTEYEAYHTTLAVLTWTLFNFIWLLIFRRPAVSAALSLGLIASLITLSLFKSSILWMTLNFFDVLIVDPETISFLLSVFPQLRSTLLIYAALALPLTIVLWRIDRFRVPRRYSLLGIVACLALLTPLSLSVPERGHEPFQNVNHVSNFSRSAATQVVELMNHGWFSADERTAASFRFAAAEPCVVPQKPPNIVLVLDESSFDVRPAPGIKVTPDYDNYFRSFDGKQRNLIVEATGGPTWYAEYNVLTGLSARSFGAFMFYVTRLAAGRVARGLPHSLRRCGYKPITIYPTPGAFLGAKRFHATTGVDRFIDMNDLGVPNDRQPDEFYYGNALRTIGKEKGTAPLFLFIYTAANHFPWNYTYQPELTPGWKPLGNDPLVDEYIRRQHLSARAFKDFREKLAQQFPDEQFLIVRFGDHQPGLSARILEPGLSESEVGRRILAFEQKYFTTYYSVDGVNYTPKDLSSALDTLEAAYLPIMIQEAAGLPLDPTFAEQKKILHRCKGVFFACRDGAEVRRFNRMLIDAGLIKDL